MDPKTLFPITARLPALWPATACRGVLHDWADQLPDREWLLRGAKMAARWRQHIQPRTNSLQQHGQARLMAASPAALPPTPAVPAGAILAHQWRLLAPAVINC